MSAASKGEPPHGACLPRHVLMTTDAVGGVWRYAADLARRLNAAGTRVTLACFGPAPSPTRAAELTGLPLTRLVEMDLPLDWLADGPRALAAVPGRIAALAASVGADLLHLNLPTQAAELRTDLPVVVASHSCVVTWWARMRAEPLPQNWHWQRALNAAGLERADVVVAPSQAFADELAAAYGADFAIRVVPNAVVAGEATTGPRDPVVLAAARWWDEGKNGALLDAIAALSPWPVEAAGACEGPNGQRFAFTAARALGELSADVVRARMRQAAIFVSPSRYEPFGLAALEAAEAGAALVLADIPTYREIWEGAALFAAPDEPAAFAAAVAALAADPARLRDAGAKARERALAFSSDRQFAALAAAYATAAARHAAPPLLATGS